MKTLTTTLLLTLLVLGGCSQEEEQELICDIKGNSTNHDLVTGEKNNSESFSTWYVQVNIPEGKFLFGTSKEFLSGCSSDNSIFWRLTVSESSLFCEELHDGKSKFEGGYKNRVHQIPDGPIIMYLETPKRVTLNRHSLRFTRNWETTQSTKFKSGDIGSNLLSGEQTGVCKKGNKQL